MIRYLSILLFLLLCSPRFGHAQCNGNLICVENGYDLPARGPVGVLLIFAEWDCDNDINDPKWPAGGLPQDVSKYQDSDLFSPPASTDKFSQYFWDASFGQLRVYTDYYPAVVTVPCGSNRSAVFAAIQTQVNLGNPDFLRTSEGRLPSYFDTVEGEGQHGLPKFEGSNDRIDGVAVIWRNNTTVAGSDCSGFAFSSTAGANTTIPYIDDNGVATQVGIGTLGDWRDSKGTCPLIQVEFMHTLLGGNHWHAGSGAGRHTLPFAHGGYGMNVQGNSSSYAACGWDRFTLGWQSPMHLSTSRIAAIEQNVGVVETDFSTPFAGERTFILRDFYKSGDAIRLKLPHFNHNGLNGGAKNQYLWIENHQRSVPADQSNFESYPCKSPWSKGIYSYIQIGKDLKSGVPLDLYGTGNFNRANSAGSWLYPMTAEGKYDFVYREDLASEGSTNPGCINTGRTMPIDRKASNDFPNPFTGNSDLDPKLYDLDVNGNKDGFLEKGVDDYPLGWSELIDGTVVFNLHRFGDADDAFTLAGNNKIGIGTNPSNTPVYTLLSGNEMDANTSASQPSEPYENRTIRLNGLSIEIVNEITNTAIVDLDGNPTTDLVVKVRWDDYLIDQHQRWCGEIVLQDDPNDTWQAQVILGKGRELTLDQGTSPTAYYGTLQADGSYLFADPTVMTIESGTKLHLLEQSNLTIKNGSTLVIEDGAEVVLENGACIVVEEGGFLQLNGNNIQINGADALISVRGTLRTADNVDFTFTGDGYVDFYENHVLEMGIGSNFVLQRSSGDPGYGDRFMLIRDFTTVNITKRQLILEGGTVFYDNEAKLAAADADVLFTDVTFTDLDNPFNSNNNSTGFEGTDLLSCAIDDCTFEHFELGLNLVGNTTLPDISSSHFLRNIKGLVIQGMDEVNLTGNNIKLNTQEGIRIEQVDIANFNGNWIELNPIGCALDQVNFAYLSGTNISKSTSIGVLAVESNVFLNDGGAIFENGTGVYFSKSSTTTDWFLLSVGKCNCGKIINNNIGVKGEDVILDIDRIEHGLECTPTPVSPNRFDGNNTVFDICYSQQFVSPILMRGNYWGGQGLGNNYSIVYGNGVFCGIGTVPVNDLPFSTTYDACGNLAGFIDPNAPSQFTNEASCEFMDGNSFVSVHEQSRQAFYDLYHRDYDNAKTKYNPVAALDFIVHNGASCVNKIHIARCITDAIDNDQHSSPRSDWLPSAIQSNSVQPTDISIYPNPTHSVFTIESQSNEDQWVKMYDIYGRLIQTFTFNQKQEINVADLAKGLYILEISSTDNDRVTTEKLLVE